MHEERGNAPFREWRHDAFRRTMTQKRYPGRRVDDWGRRRGYGGGWAATIKGAAPVGVQANEGSDR